MKKLFILAFICLNSANSFSQGLFGTKWSKGGDVLTSTDWFGSSNTADVIFKSNNTIRFRINSDGKMVFSNNPIIFDGFAGIGSTGLFRYDATGKLIALPFTSIGSDVLRGDGTFGSVFAAAGWNSFPGITYTSNKVGIGGITTPVEALEVLGNGIFSGSVSATEFKAGDVFGQGRSLSIVSGLCMKGFDATVPGSRSEICGMGNDLYFQSTLGLNNNTILNFSNLGNVGIGTNAPTAKLHVNGNFQVDGETFYTGKTHVYRISALPGDSIIRIGDSTLLVNTITNMIYPTGAGTFNKGLGLGSSTSYAFGMNTVAIGNSVFAGGNKSFAMGNNATANSANSVAIGNYAVAGANNAISIGNGTSSTYLNNNVANSIMMSSNSTLPSLYLAPSTSSTSIGKIGMGTKTPLGDFQFIKPTPVDFYVSTASYDPAKIWVSNNWLAYTFGIDNTGMGQITDGLTPIISFMHGNVGIGTTCLPFGYAYKLSVDGKIACEGIKVQYNDASGCWPDFVFEKTYKLRSLYELEQYVILNKHLPDVPSGKEVVENGLDLEETNKALLKTLEEHSLYLIQLKKENDDLRQSIEELKTYIKK